jgi:hypothetical protein
MSPKTWLAAAVISVATLLSGSAAVAVASAAPAVAATAQHAAPDDTWT